MKLKELKKIINEIPDEYDDYPIIFGDVTPGEKLKKIIKLGKKIVLSFI